MNLRTILPVVCVCLLATLARGQTRLETPGAAFYFAGPTTASPIDWPNTHLFLLRRKEQPIHVKAIGSGAGTVELDCSVKACSAQDAPMDLAIRLGLNAPPDPSVGVVVPTDRAERLESALPKSSSYLALVTKPRNKKWSELGPVVPRLFVPVSPDLKVAVSAGKPSILEAVFRAINASSATDSQMIVRWAYQEWKAEGAPYLHRMEPAIPDNPSLATISGDPTNLRIGQVAIDEARKALPTARTYLAVLGGLWGNSARFTPFFQACQDTKTEAQPDLLISLVSDPSFYELEFNEALALANKVKRPLAGVILRFTRMSGAISTDQLKDLFLLSSGMRMQDRRRVYLMMVPSLPLELQKDFPAGLIPDYKSDGSTPHEQEYRQKWASYLGVNESAKP